MIKWGLSTRLRKAIVHTQVEGTLFSGLLVIHHLHVPPKDVSTILCGSGDYITWCGNVIHSEYNRCKCILLAKVATT